jgi:hypothetical protein
MDFCCRLIKGCDFILIEHIEFQAGSFIALTLGVEWSCACRADSLFVSKLKAIDVHGHCGRFPFANELLEKFIGSTAEVGGGACRYRSY